MIIKTPHISLVCLVYANEMPIAVLDHDILPAFIKGEVAFKIVSSNRNLVDMVNTRDDYTRKMFSHRYTPLLYAADVFIRLAYLYGCLSLEFHNPRTETFTFLARKIGTDVWVKWFVVSPSIDHVY